MAQAFITTGMVQKGQLKVRNQQAFHAALSTWKDGEVIVRIERAVANRSSQANRYYWGVIIHAISEHTGYTPEETHEALKQLFLPKQLAMCDGNGEVHGSLVIGGSTSSLNRHDFGDYCTRIREWAIEHLGMDIPSPSGGA